MKFGDFDIQVFVEQHFLLDGGMMFGVVPKTMWNKLIPSDENNLIPFNTNLYVVTFNGKRMIFDVGLGDTLSDRECKVYCTDGTSYMDSGLTALGLKTSDIDYVFLSHLHSDHAAAIVKQVDGQYLPRFEKAKYLIGREEWEAAMHPDERTAPVYSPPRLLTIKDAGQLELIDGNTELFPGIRTVFTGGHSVGHLALEMESQNKRVYYYGDIFPTRHHMKVAYVPATDVFPLQTMEAKRKILPKLLNEDIVLAFDHDVVATLATVSEQERKIIVSPV